MDGQRIVLIATAIAALGIFVMPSTVSLFSGQHYWYNISGRSNEVPCEKCHADIAEEMKQIAGPHTGETGYGRFKCDYCHRTFDLNDYGKEKSKNINQSIFSRYYYTYASGDGTGAQPGKEAHAASTVPCMYCHSGEDVGGRGTHGTPGCVCHGGDDGGDPYYYHGDRFYTSISTDEPGECVKCHQVIGNYVLYVPPAGGFNLTANSSDTGRIAAHKSFVMVSISNELMEDANEACIACHTGIPVQINWTHTMNLVFNASYCSRNLKETPTHFNTSDYDVNGTVLVISYGNWSGGAKNGSWPEGNIDIWSYNKAS